MKKKIFVTGSKGFLGSHLVSRLKIDGHQVDCPSSKEVNLFSEKHLNKIKKKYDEIYHLAVWTEAGDFCLKYPAFQWIKNQTINLNIEIGRAHV